MQGPLHVFQRCTSGHVYDFDYDLLKLLIVMDKNVVVLLSNVLVLFFKVTVLLIVCDITFFKVPMVSM